MECDHLHRKPQTLSEAVDIIRAEFSEFELERWANLRGQSFIFEFLPASCSRWVAGARLGSWL